MPEGPLGFDRRLAKSVLELDLTFTKDVPVGRNMRFTSDFMNSLRGEKLILNRDTDIEVDTEKLPPNERVKQPLGNVIDEVGTLTIEFANPAVIEIEDLITFLDNINAIIYNTLESQGMDVNKLVGTDGTLSAKINGPVGGPRPFINAELTLETLYIDEISEDEAIEAEDIFQDIKDMRVDAKTEGNVLLVNLRTDEINRNELRGLRAIPRDIGRSINNELETVSIMPDGSRF